MRLCHRLGYLPKLERSIWIHAESVGEVNAAVVLIRKLKQAYPQVVLLITVQTRSGFNQARKQLGDIAEVAYAPFDLLSLTKRAVFRINPIVLLSIENAIWPSRFNACTQNNTPVILANAKIGSKSFRFYSRFPKIAGWILKDISCVLAASYTQSKRFEHLGLKNIHILGDLKFT